MLVVDHSLGQWFVLEKKVEILQIERQAGVFPRKKIVTISTLMALLSQVQNVQEIYWKCITRQIRPQVMI